MESSTAEFLERQPAFERLSMFFVRISAARAWAWETGRRWQPTHVRDESRWPYRRSYGHAPEGQSGVRARSRILVEGAMALPVTHGGGVLFAS